MRSLLPLLSILVLLAGGAWLLLSAGDEEPTALELGPVVAPGAGREAGPLELAAPTSPPGSGTRRGPKGSTEPVIIDPRTLPRGPLDVLVLGPDDVPIPHDEVRVSLEPGTGAKAWHATPLLRPDPETNVWRGNDAVGPVRVRVSGDTLVAKDVETQVTAEAGEPLRVHVDRAGALDYTITRFGAEPLTEVTLTLLDGARRPVLVGYQVRTETLLTQPSQARSMTQAPRGVIFGIPPGRYTLRVTSAADESAEAEVDVEARKTVPVALQLLR
jgi:hypothetical protein